MSFSRDVRELRFNAQEALDRTAEMPQIPEGVKPNSVRTEHPRHQFATARMAAKNLIRREGGVQKKPNPERGSRGFQHRREQHQLVIMHPDQIAFLRSLNHLISEDLVDVLV